MAVRSSNSTTRGGTRTVNLGYDLGSDLKAENRSTLRDLWLAIGSILAPIAAAQLFGRRALLEFFNLVFDDDHAGRCCGVAVEFSG